MQALLSTVAKKSATQEGNEITLSLPAREKTLFNSVARIISGVISKAETLPAISREMKWALLPYQNTFVPWISTTQYGGVLPKPPPHLPPCLLLQAAKL